jgi:hypothetical protein
MFLRDSDRLHFKYLAQVFDSGYLGQVDKSLSNFGEEKEEEGWLGT